MSKLRARKTTPMGRQKQPDLTREQRIEKLMSNVEPCPTTGCWIWTGSLNPHGYGRICHSRKVFYAHKESYDLLVGPNMEETLDHTCNVRCCVNPQHLSPCTRSENTSRSPSRRVLCGKGMHLMLPDNLYVLKNGKKAGYRMCKQCAIDRSRKHRTPEKNKEYNDRFRAKNLEQVRSDDRARYAANREERCAKQREYERKKRAKEAQLKRFARGVEETQENG